MELKYRDSDEELLVMGFMPGLTAGAGETVVQYSGAFVSPVNHYRYDVATTSIVEKSAGDKTIADEKVFLAASTDVQTRYDTKSTDADRIIFLKDLIKLMCDGQQTIENVKAL